MPRRGATFSAYTYPLPIDKHRQVYQRGVGLVSTSICDVPPGCWPNSIKIRSRLHYYLAQLQACSISPDAQPILLDLQDQVSDSAIASIVGWNPTEGLIVRPAELRYASISVDVLVELAKQLGIAITERTFSVAELQCFPEAFLVSTPWCLYPVRNVDNVQLSGYASNFPVFKRILTAWESTVGCSILTEASI